MVNIQLKKITVHRKRNANSSYSHENMINLLIITKMQLKKCSVIALLNYQTEKIHKFDNLFC